MKSYSLDLRERVAAACAAARAHHRGGSDPVQRVGFICGEATAPPPHERVADGAALAWLLLDAAARAELVACLRQQPDATLDELRVWGGRAGRTGCEPGHAGAGGADTGLAAKKKSVHAAERVRALRAAFGAAGQAEDFICFKFVDETSTNLTYGRRYARAGGGQRAHQATPRHGGPNVTLVAALTPHGLQAAMTVSGAVNGDVFAAYLDQVLGPMLVPGDVVVLDNLPATKWPAWPNWWRPAAPACCICRLTRPISIPLNWPSASSKRYCARPKPVPGRPWKPSFRPSPAG